MAEFHQLAEKLDPFLLKKSKVLLKLQPNVCEMQNNCYFKIAHTGL